MPKKGGKKKKRGPRQSGEKRELVLKDEGQEYAQVTKMLGNGRLTANCFDGKERMCHIRGKMIKRIWINLNDVILISLRDFQDDKADVIMKYSEDEARALKANGHLPNVTKINESVEEEELNDQIDEIQFEGEWCEDTIDDI